MLTKTGELLMRRKNQKMDGLKNKINPLISESLHQNMIVQAKPYKKYNNISHVTHVNQYNFICVSNKSSHQLQVSKQILKQLQIQNFRLIEQNMKLVEWSKNFLLKTKQRIMRTIQGIQQFRYLQSVNRLYELVEELTEYESSGFQMPKISNKEHYLNLKKLNNPESKNAIPIQFQMRNLINFIYNPMENRPKIQIPKREEQQKQVVLTPTFLNQKIKPDYSEYEPTEGQQHLLNMLVLQSLCIQSFVFQNMK